MKKIVIEGKTYKLLDIGEVTYGLKPASKYDELKRNYEETVIERMKFADENERLEYELQKVEDILQAVTRERDILRMVAKRWEARVGNISSRETLTEKLNKMSDKMKALQEVVDEIRARDKCKSMKVHELTIARDAGRRVIKEYMEALSELEDENKRLQSTLEDERWQQLEDEKRRVQSTIEFYEAKKTRIRDILFSRALLKMKKGGKE